MGAFREYFGTFFGNLTLGFPAKLSSSFRKKLLKELDTVD